MWAMIISLHLFLFRFSFFSIHFSLSLYFSFFALPSLPSLLVDLIYPSHFLSLSLSTPPFLHFVFLLHLPLSISLDHVSVFLSLWIRLYLLSPSFSIFNHFFPTLSIPCFSVYSSLPQYPFLSFFFLFPFFIFQLFFSPSFSLSLLLYSLVILSRFLSICISFFPYH